MKIIKLLLPIAIYFIVEWLEGPLCAVLVAGGLSVLQFFGELVVSRKVNASYLIDIVLVALFGALEYFAEGNARRIVLAVSPLVMAALVILSMHSRFDIFGGLGGGLVANMLRNPYNRYNLRRSQRQMVAWCAVCSVLYFVSCLIPDSAFAAWTDKFLLFTAFAAYIAMEIIVGRINAHKYRGVEWVPLMTEDGKVIGSAPRPLVHNGSLWLHPVVHLHIMDGKKLLLQLRPMSKKIQPGKWDTAVGGHIAAGETIEKALKREAWEETGLRDATARLAHRYVWKCPVEHEYVFSFIAESKGPFSPANVGEVDELRFWTREQIEENLGKGVFTPNLEHELRSWLLDELAK